MSTQPPIPSVLHLKSIPFSSLPAHSSLPASPNRPALHRFLLSVLTEANLFISETVPQDFKVDKKLRSSPPSEAKVQLSSKTIQNKPGSTSTRSEDEEEYWVSRRSVHIDLAERGTASFEEFVKGLRDDHTANEMAYTPSVSNVEKLLEWDCEADGEVEGGWGDVKISAVAITHTFNPSFLISPRIFLVLVITASLPPPASATSSSPESPGFLTVQIPLNRYDLDKDGSIGMTTPSKRAIFASYASVERVVPLPKTAATPARQQDPHQRTIEWSTATTSDAGGWIPQCVQRSWSLGGVPRAVVHDVGLFMDWVDGKRKQS